MINSLSEHNYVNITYYVMSCTLRIGVEMTSPKFVLHNYYTVVVYFRSDIINIGPTYSQSYNILLHIRGLSMRWKQYILVENIIVDDDVTF